MAKYIIKKHDEKWIWDFESEKLELRFTADGKKFESNADILAFLKELKFYEADKLQIEENRLILNGEILTESITVEIERDDLIFEFKEAAITWKNEKDNPAHQEQTDFRWISLEESIFSSQLKNIAKKSRKKIQKKN